MKTATECGHCKDDYYVTSTETDKGFCAKSNNFIEGCVLYPADSICEQCSEGKLRSDKKACDKNPVFSQCEFYSEFLSCFLCTTGFGLDKNKYLYDVKTSDVLAKNFLKNNLENKTTGTWFMKSKDDVCLKQVENCTKFVYFNECQTCNDGYFKGSDGTCVINPLETKPFCLQYENATTCLKCSSGYYLNGSNDCILQEQINECEEYSITEEGVCSLCRAEFYFSSPSCKKRENTIKFCLTYEPASDTCKVCSEGYILSDNNTKCSDAISKCQSYYFLPSPDGGQKSVCQTCLDGFYLKTQISGGDIITSCELPSPSILGCIKYGSNDTCLECVTGFYLANSKCHTHNSQITEKLSCVNYSTIRLNECETCPNEHYLYTLYNYCEDLTSEEIIKNCNIYNLDKTCYQCESDYYVSTEVDSKTNKTIYSCTLGKKEFCVTLNRVNAACMECNKVFFKIPNNSSTSNSCVDMPDFQKNRCTSYNLDSTELYPICQDCEAPYYPITWADLHYGFCADPAQITNLYFGYSDTNTTFDNCEILDLKSQKKCRKCNQSQTNKYIDFKNFSCVAACADDEIVETFGFEENILSPVSYLACKTKLLVPMVGEVENCYRVDYSSSTVSTGSFFQAMSPICMQCKTGGFLGVINDTISSYYSIYDYLPLSEESSASAEIQATSFWHPRNKLSGFHDCINFGDFTNMTGKYFEGTVSSVNNPETENTAINVNNAFYNTDPQVSAIEHCHSLIEKDLRYGCNSCKWGYRGVMTTDSDSSLNFLAACSQIPDCDTSVYYGGIGNHDPNAIINLQATCHKCNTDTKIPTLTFSTIVNTQSTVTNKKQYYTIDCMTFGNPNDDADYITAGVKFVENCAMQEMVEGLPQWLSYSSEIPHPNPVCIACKPGYRATIGPTIKERPYTYISECTLIEDCEATNTSFNICDECSTGFVFKYESQEPGLSRYDECVATKDNNCLIGEENGKCYKCKPQYHLNVDGYCDFLENEGCESFGNLKTLTTSFEYLNFNPFGNGCLKCASDKVNVRMPYKQTSCVQSMWNTVELSSISVKYFIANCTKFYHDVDFGVLCRECNTGFVHSTNDKNCVVNTVVDKCLKYSSEDLTQCSKCEDYYYLDGNSCVLGLIPSCIEYNNQTTCIKCKDDNIPTRAKNGQYTLCFNRSNSLKNCLSIDANEGFKGVISCTQCSNTSYPVSFDLSIKTCARFYAINQCIEYDLQSKFEDSSFFCNECTPMFYAKQDQFPNICEQRSHYPIPNCLIYEKTIDKCKTCIDNFYLSSSGLVCEPNPIGMVGCVVFKSIEECFTCDDAHYQDNFVCKAVENLISNCEIYETETICQKCKKEYNLINNKCSKVELENCITVGYYGECDQCTDGYQYIQEKCEAVNLANCITYLTKNDCLICEDGYYVSSGRCLEVVIIANCLKNATRDTCAQCASGYVLEPDATACTEMTTDEKSIYNNVKCQAYQRDNTCLQCKEDYYFSKTFDQCLKCSATANCAYCDFKDPSKCIMCKSGYSMKPYNANECVSNSVYDEEVIVPPEVIPDIYIVDENCEFVMLIKWILLLVNLWML